MKKQHHFLLYATMLLAFLGMSASPLRAQTTAGKEFWLTFGLSPSYTNPNDYEIQVRVVSGINPVQGDIYFTNSGTSQPFSIGAQQVYTHSL